MIALTVNEFILFTHLKDKNQLPDPAISFCDHWLYTKVTNKQRLDKKPYMSELAFYKAMKGLIKKKLVKNAYYDNYYFLDPDAPKS
jgi:hypothetical protein